MRKSRCGTLILFVFLACPAFSAVNLAFSRNARTFETQQSSLVVKGLAHACLSAFEIPDSLPCNPAFVGYNKGTRFGIQALISNGYQTLDKMRRLMDGEINQDLINALFGEDRVLQIEGNAELDFISPFLNAKYSPISVKYFSVVRNEANPLVDLYAVQEDNLVFQTGHKIYGPFYAGLQLRSVNRKFVRQQFRLLDLATQTGKDQLKPKTQRALYLEPGVSFVTRYLWKWRASLMLVNAGFVNEVHPEFPVPSELQGGIAFSPPVPLGDMDIFLDYRSMNFEEAASEKFRLGAMYHLGAMYLQGGVDYNGISGGVFYGLQQVNAGIVYSTTNTPWQNNDFVAQTVYVQIGWQI